MPPVRHHAASIARTSFALCAVTHTYTGPNEKTPAGVQRSFQDFRNRARALWMVKPAAPGGEHPADVHEKLIALPLVAIVTKLKPNSCSLSRCVL